MTSHSIVSRQQWLEARKAHLEREKALDRERDTLSAERRALPWVEVEQDYVFEGSNGKVKLSDLFDGKSQLIIQHFMFHPDWEAGCPHCSFWADGFDPMTTHLENRDAAFAVVSRAPLERLEAYKKRMGWSFRWLSSHGTSFNYDYAVSATDDEMERGKTVYNYRETEPMTQEMPGLSVFYRDRDGSIYHTYSTYARGLDRLNAAYHLMDMLPKGRDEEALPYPQAWVRRHDEYEPSDG